MNIVIVGAGEVGTHIASQLVAEQKDVVIIEKDPECAAKASNMLDCLVITGEGSNVDILKQAGAENADIFIAATSVDEVNMISCFVAGSAFNTPVKIARVRNVDYMRGGLLKNSSIGIDYLVNPEIEAAFDIVQTVLHGASSGIFAFQGTNAQLRDFLVKDDSIFNGVLVKDIRSIIDQNFIIAGVLRNEMLHIPKGDFQILTGDHIYIVALGKSFNKILTRAGMTVDKLKRIVLVGGGLIGKHIAGMLIEDGKDVRIIEKDYERCKELSALYPEATVINGNISDQDVFEEENIANTDAIITTTQSEELNILAGVYAKSKGVKRAVALIDKLNYTTLATNLGIDSCISAKLSSVDAILKFIRKGNIKNVYTIFEGQAEAIEFIVGSSNKNIIGKKIMDLKFPSGCLIIAVQRHRKTIIPTGSLVIEEGDSIITFAAHDEISRLEELFNK
ncbi:Trk system potassium transporter TrkA [Mucispirillum schaedleri]|uniref:Trk system potassium transporter TrkA n=1 Tax=Mucispirillum schaedleri TaxID=248039 RepID=UPI001F5627C0|nr:Trk system potassium transporter TrkA [Mucispirillum schaedleri]